jgi:hypothetical protein
LLPKKLIDPKKDIVYNKGFFNQKLTGGFAVILKNGSRKHKDTFCKCLLLRELCSERSLLEDLLRLPKETKIHVDSKGNLKSVEVPEKNGPKLSGYLEKEVYFFETMAYVMDWNSNIRQISAQTLSECCIKGRQNLLQLKKERKALFNSYQTMTGFSSAFKNLFGTSYKAFFHVTSELLDSCYRNDNNLLIEKTYRLEKSLQSCKGVNKKDIQLTLRILTQNKILQNSLSNVFARDGWTLANFHRLEKAQLVLSQHVFDEVYENSLKGWHFEDGCRKLLAQKGMQVIPRRIEIFEPTLPSLASKTLYGKEKQRSDIDVVACFNNKLVVMECKEIKDVFDDRKTKTITKSLVEHHFKTIWIAENFEKFKDYLGSESAKKLSIDDSKPIYIISLFVTNKPIDASQHSLKPITYLELKEINLETDIADDPSKGEGFFELQILGRKVVIPWIAVRSV